MVFVLGCELGVIKVDILIGGIFDVKLEKFYTSECLNCGCGCVNLGYGQNNYKILSWITLLPQRLTFCPQGLNPSSVALGGTSKVLPDLNTRNFIDCS